MRLALDLFSIFAIGAGVFFFFAGTVALVRFPNSLSRLHALTKADNLGLGFVVLGLLPRAESRSPRSSSPSSGRSSSFRARRSDR